MRAPAKTPGITSKAPAPSGPTRSFFSPGENTVAGEILTDMINICQGLHPEQMKVLEIGCGAGRVTRSLSPASLGRSTPVRCES